MRTLLVPPRSAPLTPCPPARAMVCQKNDRLRAGVWNTWHVRRSHADDRRQAAPSQLSGVRTRRLDRCPARAPVSRPASPGTGEITPEHDFVLSYTLG
jgi:hypothetical protein